MDRVEELRAKIEELKKRWPAHTVPPALVMELDELETALDEALKARQQGNQDAEVDRSR
ncbi:MAG TPA: histidine kinase [Anaerolineae bacterium]|nr:histidine kinase [Anaerolineae bacterium]